VTHPQEPRPSAVDGCYQAPDWAEALSLVRYLIDDFESALRHNKVFAESGRSVTSRSVVLADSQSDRAAADLRLLEFKRGDLLESLPEKFVAQPELCVAVRSVPEIWARCIQALKNDGREQDENHCRLTGAMADLFRGLAFDAPERVVTAVYDLRGVACDIYHRYGAEEPNPLTDLVAGFDSRAGRMAIPFAAQRRVLSNADSSTIRAFTLVMDSLEKLGAQASDEPTFHHLLRCQYMALTATSTLPPPSTSRTATESKHRQAVTKFLESFLTHLSKVQSGVSWEDRRTFEDSFHTFMAESSTRFPRPSDTTLGPLPPEVRTLFNDAIVEVALEYDRTPAAITGGKQQLEPHVGTRFSMLARFLDVTAQLPRAAYGSPAVTSAMKRFLRGVDRSSLTELIAGLAGISTGSSLRVSPFPMTRPPALPPPPPSTSETQDRHQLHEKKKRCMVQ
jgi:hypothetical protein